MAEIYDEDGNPVEDVNMIPYGTNVSSRSSSGSSDSNSVGGNSTKSSSSKSSSGTTTTTKTAYEGPIPQIPVTPIYEPRSYEESGRGKLFSDMISRADAKKEERLKNNLSQSEIARRKGRYLAWNDMLNSLGRVSGRGYVHVPELDNKRTLAAFDKLDELRNEAYKIQNDDDLNWIQKLALEDRIKHDAQEINRQQNSIKQQQTDLYHNATIRSQYERGLAGTDKSYSSDSSTTKNSDTGYWSQSHSDRRSNGSTVTDTYRNPEFMWYTKAGGKSVNIGKTNNVPVTSDEANRIYNAVNDLILEYGNSIPEDGPREGVMYEINLGGGKAKIDEKTLHAIATSLGKIMKVIENDPTSEESVRSLPRVIDEMDRLSGYTISDYYREHGNMAGYIPSTGARPATETSAQAGQAGGSAASKWDANKRSK